MSDFKWKIAVNGYAWAEDYRSGRRDKGGRLESDGRVLVPRDLVADVPGADGAGFVSDDGRRGRLRVQYRYYDPFRENGMFRDFADLPPAEHKIREFADRYGTLGADGSDIPPAPRKARLTENQREGHDLILTSHEVAQTYDHWRRAIADMAEAVGLLDRLPPDRAGKDAERLQTLIQDKLEVTGVVARFRLAPPPAGQKPLHIAPVNLHGAMWLQLAFAVSDEKEFRRCLHCGRWFKVGAEVSRATKRYCKDKCKSLAYRARIARALDLRRSGKTVPQIAADLDSDESTVRRWVGG